jgi:hypothetical protein
MKHGFKETNIGIATDLRRRQQPPESADYMGNMALFSKGTMSIADLMAADWYVNPGYLPGVLSYLTLH